MSHVREIRPADRGEDQLRVCEVRILPGARLIAGHREGKSDVAKEVHVIAALRIQRVHECRIFINKCELRAALGEKPSDETAPGPAGADNYNPTHHILQI